MPPTTARHSSPAARPTPARDSPCSPAAASPVATVQWPVSLVVELGEFAFVVDGDGPEVVHVRAASRGYVRQGLGVGLAAGFAQLVDGRAHVLGVPRRRHLFARGSGRWIRWTVGNGGPGAGRRVSQAVVHLPLHVGGVGERQPRGRATCSRRQGTRANSGASAWSQHPHLGLGELGPPVVVAAVDLHLAVAEKRPHRLGLRGESAPRIG